MTESPWVRVLPDAGPFSSLLYTISKVSLIESITSNFLLEICFSVQLGAKQARTEQKNFNGWPDCTIQAIPRVTGAEYVGRRLNVLIL